MIEVSPTIGTTTLKNIHGLYVILHGTDIDSDRIRLQDIMMVILITLCFQNVRS